MHYTLCSCLNLYGEFKQVQKEENWESSEKQCQGCSAGAWMAPFFIWENQKNLHCSAWSSLCIIFKWEKKNLNIIFHFRAKSVLSTYCYLQVQGKYWQNRVWLYCLLSYWQHKSHELPEIHPVNARNSLKGVKSGSTSASALHFCWQRMRHLQCAHFYSGWCYFLTYTSTLWEEHFLYGLVQPCCWRGCSDLSLLSTSQARGTERTWVKAECLCTDHPGMCHQFQFINYFFPIVFINCV